jgi:putative transposase
VWKKRFGHLGVAEVCELRQTREGNSKLKRLVADLTLDKHILTEIVRKKV